MLSPTVFVLTFVLYEELLNECQSVITVDLINARTAPKEISSILEDSLKYDIISKNGLFSIENSYNWAAQEKRCLN